MVLRKNVSMQFFGLKVFYCFNTFLFLFFKVMKDIISIVKLIKTGSNSVTLK